MKKVLKKHNVLAFMSIFIILIIFTGCSKDDDIDTDEYYVKYEVNSSARNVGGLLDVTINTENNTDSTLKIKQRVPWEVVIGPVKKDFNATLNVI